MKRQPPPPFAIVGPSGQPTLVTPRSVADTIGDLAHALGLDRDIDVSIDGRATSRVEPLVASGIRAGSTLTIRHGTESAPPSAPTVPAGHREAIVVTGPDCAAAVPLRPGRHVVGRAGTAHIRIADPSIELHHGVLDVSSDGEVTFTQLAGFVPALVGRRPCTRQAMPVAVGGSVAIGASRIEIRGAETRGSRSSRSAEGPGGVTASAADPWRRVVQRGPGPVAPAARVPVVVPGPAEVHPSPPATGLVGAAVAVIGAGAVAFLLGQMMFALFALIGALASVGTWVIGVLAAVRRRRRDRAASRVADRRFVAELEDAHRRAAALHDDENRSIEDALTDASSVGAAPVARTAIWSRRLGGDDCVLRAVIGRGTQRLTPAVVSPHGRDVPHDLVLAIERASSLDDVAVSVTLHAGVAVAVHGASSMTQAAVRSVIVQLATRFGPADWRLVVISHDPARWQWVTWLAPVRRSPSSGPGDNAVLDAGDADRLGAALDAARPDGGRRVVLVVDDPSLFTIRTGPLRRFIEMTSPTTIAIVETGATVPAICERVLTIGAAGNATWDGEGADDDAITEIRICGVSIETADRAARGLAGLIDPEDDGAEEATLAASLSLTDVDELIDGAADGDRARRRAARMIARRWGAAGTDPSPCAPIGRSADGLVELDLVRDGPHGLIAGTTGSGKSELLRSLVVGLALRLSPDHVTFVLVDYKGGATFDACARLPHTVGVVTDLDAGLAERALISLDAEIRRREHLLRAVGASDLTEFRDRPGADVLPRLVVVIDEFAALAKELPDFLAALVGVAQRGRSLGIHLILATQRPAGVVNDEIRANTNLRLALRLTDSADARDVVDDDRPADFSRRHPGRAVLRLGPDESVVFQSARCTGPVRTKSTGLRAEPIPPTGTAAPDDGSDGRRAAPVAMTELEVAVALIADAAELAGVAAPHRPWVEPLPQELMPVRVDDAVGVERHDAIGLIDDPGEQRRRPLRWDHTAGNLALVGALGSGTTSTLIALVAARCRVAEPEVLHCYVVDGRGDGALDGLAGVAHCGAIVRLGETERLHRLLRRLVDDIESRSLGGAGRTDVMVAIDGLGSLRTALSSIDLAPTLALLDRVLSDGPAVGVTACWSQDVSAALGGGRPDAETWIFHVDDPAAVRGLGGGRVPVPDGVPGRLRIAPSTLEAQVAIGAAGLASLPDRASGRGPSGVEALPMHVAAATLPIDIGASGPIANPGGLELPVGLASDDLRVARLRVPPLDHVFIGGAALTGKTGALAQITTAWQQLHPTGVVLVIDRGAGLTEAGLGAVGDDRPALIVVDDAERVDDANGMFASILTGGRPGLTIVAAARLDAVRSSYGHWTRDVARSRCGLIMTSAGDVDGDLLGVTLPRRSLIAPRPGLGWLIDGAGLRLVQVAEPDPVPTAQVGDGGESPSSQRGPAPNVRAESSGL